VHLSWFRPINHM